MFACGKFIPLNIEISSINPRKITNGVVESKRSNMPVVDPRTTRSNFLKIDLGLIIGSIITIYYVTFEGILQGNRKFKSCPDGC